MTTYFDDALPAFANIVSRVLTNEALLSNLFLRDATGRLTFVVIDTISPDALHQIKSQAKSLYPYVESEEEAVASPEHLLDESLKTSDAGRVEYIKHDLFTGFVRLVERRIVGQDWLTPPRDPIAGLAPVVVFASHKGGVGRSTALAVAAADFASSNQNVLAIDLDLEAPGIGGMLLDTQSTPEFGALDFFVENGLQSPDTIFLRSMIGVSPITMGRGIVHVIPVNGRRSDKHPQNVLGKISRAYLEDPQPSGKPKTFLDQARDLLAAVSTIERYDVILVDVRAGLNETTAAAILGLGADILLFGVNTPQTFEGYRYLLSHLASFKPELGAQNDWRYRLKMVQAKAPANPEMWKSFRNSSFELFSEQLYDVDLSGDVFNFNLDDPDAPHSAWPILNDSNYLEFDPLINRDQLANSFYARTFGDFLKGLRDRLGLKEINGNAENRP